MNSKLLLIKLSVFFVIVALMLRAEGSFTLYRWSVDDNTKKAEQDELPCIRLRSLAILASSSTAAAGQLP